MALRAQRGASVVQPLAKYAGLADLENPGSIKPGIRTDMISSDQQQSAALSFNGRTARFERADLGSIPGRAANSPMPPTPAR